MLSDGLLAAVRDWCVAGAVVFVLAGLLHWFWDPLDRHYGRDQEDETE